jgi:hypothetical protein
LRGRRPQGAVVIAGADGTQREWHLLQCVVRAYAPAD